MFDFRPLQRRFRSPPDPTQAQLGPQDGDPGAGLHLLFFNLRRSRATLFARHRFWDRFASIFEASCPPFWIVFAFILDRFRQLPRLRSSSIVINLRRIFEAVWPPFQIVFTLFLRFLVFTLFILFYTFALFYAFYTLQHFLTRFNYFL